MHWDTFKHDNYSAVGGGRGCRVGEVRAGTTSPIPSHCASIATTSTVRVRAIPKDNCEHLVQCINATLWVE